MSNSSSFDSSEDELPRKKSRKRKYESDEDFDPTSVEKSSGPSKAKVSSPKKSVKAKNANTDTKKPRAPKKLAKKAVIDPKLGDETEKEEAGPSKAEVSSPKKSVKAKNANTGTKKPRAPKKLAKKAVIDPKLGDEAEKDPVLQMEWTVEEYLASLQQIDTQIARNIIRLLDEENTIPFIARYRKELTGDMPPEKLREVKEAYELLDSIKHKANTIMNNIKKLGKLTPILERSICCSRTLSELEHIYAPFKPGSKRTLAERARQLGLEADAIALLDGTQMVNLFNKVQVGKEGLKSVEEVESGIKHIIADIISKDRLVLEKLRFMKDEAYIKLECTKARGTTKPPESLQAKQKQKKGVVESKFGKKNDQVQEDVARKFENYFNFSAPVKLIKPHQVLAINRGENLKVLSVKISIPEWILDRIMQFCYNQWLSRGMQYPLRKNIVDASVKDAYTRLMQPLIARQVRADLNQSAVRAAVEVFATNLKNLLLAPPLRGKTLMGIDPGFRHGCKIAMTSQMGEVLHTDVIYPIFGKEIPPFADPSACKLKELLTLYDCQLIALGNGTACRETESYLSYLIQRQWFKPLDVSYTIVSEQGASIYSCSPEAKKEFPSMDTNVISAVSLARRVQDPLGELVKVEPKHLGVGMYQHDVPEKQLSSTLEEVVVECVSFVGVDINTASLNILQRVAGLNEARANKILQWRSGNQSFRNRQQLLQVKGIGPKTFQQCAGFIRIIPETILTQNNCMDPIQSTSKSGAKKRKLNDNSSSDALNPLDKTWIHPESYSIATKVIEKCGVNVDTLGTPDFINKVRSAVQAIGIARLAADMNASEAAMKLICDGLQQSPGHDLRSQFSQPLFRKGLTSIGDLTPGTVLTGRVQNVTHFGVFVDIGVGRDGLVPSSKLRNMRPQLGDRVEVKVLSVEVERKRISLELIQML